MQIADFALAFTPATPPKQQSFYRLVAGCLRAGDAGKARQLVLRLSATG